MSSPREPLVSIFTSQEGLVLVSSDDEEVTDDWVAKAEERLRLIAADIKKLQTEKEALESKIAEAALMKSKSIRKESAEY